MKNKGKKTRVSKMWQSSVLDLFKEKKYYGQSSVLFVPHFFVFCERKTDKRILGSPEVQLFEMNRKSKGKKILFVCERNSAPGPFVSK